jgi:hypothetical protein
LLKTRKLILYFVYFAFVKTSKNESLLCFFALLNKVRISLYFAYFA